MSSLLFCAMLGLAATAPATSRATTQAADPPPTIDELRQHIADRVAEGFDSRNDIVEQTIAYYELEDDPRLRRQVQPLTDRAIAAHREKQATWPTVTDCDRVDQAFATLEQAGIVARQNFADCQTCGHAEIQNEIKAASKMRKVRGYVFYHWQDTEGAVNGGSLYLAYGAVDGDDGAAEKVAGEVVQALRQAGLKTDWDGSIKKRIGVTLDWKRRRSD